MRTSGLLNGGAGRGLRKGRRFLESGNANPLGRRPPPISVGKRLSNRTQGVMP
jgi:hypothetical protein